MGAARRDWTPAVVVSVAVGLMVAAPSIASAETTCPGLDASATRLEQAECWYARHRTEPASCRAPATGVGPCITEAASWCAGATMDGQHEANLCFLAFVGARRFDDAAATVSSMRDVTSEAQSCHHAFTVGVRARIVAGSAEVAIDGRSYGAAPIEATLRAPWWDHRVVARFGRGAASARVTRGPEALRDAFDEETCTMADLVIEAPADSTHDDAMEGSAFPMFGVVMTASGTAAAAAGLVLLLVAESNASDLGDDERDTEWTSAHQSRFDDIAPLRVGGGIAFGAGLVAASIGLVAILTGSRASVQTRAIGARRGLVLAPRRAGLELRWDL